MRLRPAIPVVVAAAFIYVVGRYAVPRSETLQDGVTLLRASIGLIRPLAILIGALLIIRRIMIIRAKRRPSP